MLAFANCKLALEFNLWQCCISTASGSDTLQKNGRPQLGFRCSTRLAICIKKAEEIEQLQRTLFTPYAVTLQVTFCPDVPIAAADNVQLLKLPNLQLPLYTHSFLGFGQEAALTLASTAAVSMRLHEATATPLHTGTYPFPLPSLPLSFFPCTSLPPPPSPPSCPCPFPPASSWCPSYPFLPPLHHSCLLEPKDQYTLLAILE